MSEEILTPRKAKRRAAPLLIGIVSLSGGGKTYSALKMAAGLAGPGGRVGMIDTENGRGEMYADDPGIMDEFPDGFDYLPLDPPFTPAMYISRINAMHQAGVKVCVVDSTSHEWAGIGGCFDMAHNNKVGGQANWAMAKLEHKRFANTSLLTDMHLIFCFRGAEKSKPVKEGGKTTWIQLGLQPITERDFIYEMTVSFHLDLKTHMPVPIKVPKPLLHVFEEQRLISRSHGDAIRNWNETGVAVKPIEQLQKRALLAATDGMEAYTVFFSTLSTVQKKMLADTSHGKNKEIAAEVDVERKKAETDPGVAPAGADEWKEGRE